jgi:hypothetical protein
MQWSDVIKPPPDKMLRQFAGLWLVVFGGLAAWRALSGDTGTLTIVIGTAAVLIGVAGLIAPAVVRPIYSGWMIVAFPIGWTISKISLGLMFFVLFTSVALVFRLMGRDALRIRRGHHDTYWMPKAAPRSSEEYLRQY